MATILEAAGGAEGMRRLAEAWHTRVLADEVVAHAFSHGFDPHHVERLAAYWCEALGGAPDFTARYASESDVVRMHSGNGEHEDMDRRAVGCFDAALADVGLDADPVVFGALHDYFAHVTLHRMNAYSASARDVPDDLEPIRWSWNGRSDS